MKVGTDSTRKSKIGSVKHPFSHLCALPFTSCSFQQPPPPLLELPRPSTLSPFSSYLARLHRLSSPSTAREYSSALPDPLQYSSPSLRTVSALFTMVVGDLLNVFSTFPLSPSRSNVYTASNASVTVSERTCRPPERNHGTRHEKSASRWTVTSARNSSTQQVERGIDAIALLC